MDKKLAKQFIRKAVVGSAPFRLCLKLISEKRASLHPNHSLTAVPSSEESLLEIYQPPARIMPAIGYNYEPQIDLSIVLPVYNVEEYLDECLRALLPVKAGMSYEIVAVNDGSTDSSRDILELHRRDYPEILRIIDRTNGGLSAARNTGLTEVRGAVVAFVDSDDVVNINGIWDAAKQLQSSGVDYLSGSYQWVDVSGRPLGPSQRVSSLMVPWGRVFTRKVWRDVRFPEGYWYEDLVMPYLIESRFKGAETESINYLYRKRPGSIVNSTASNPKGLDSFWLISIMLDECKRLHIPFSKVFKTTLDVMGPTLLNRSTALDSDQMRQLFYACCNLVRPIEGFATLSCEAGRYWEALRKSLVTEDYRAWCASCLAIALEEETGGAKRALELLRADREKR